VVLSTLGYLLLGFYFLIISSPLIPSAKILILAVVLTGVATLIMRRRLVRLYASGQATIRETWESTPEQDSVELPVDAEVTAYQVHEESPWIGRSLSETGLRTETGAVIVAIERAGRSIISPSPSEVIQNGDQLFVFGEGEQMLLASRLLERSGITSL
jgi:NhaP-type Na+/H+ and K+/H+ antiporter